MPFVHTNSSIDAMPAPLSFDVEEIVAYMRAIGARPRDRRTGRPAIEDQSRAGW